MKRVLIIFIYFFGHFSIVNATSFSAQYVSIDSLTIESIGHYIILDLKTKKLEYDSVEYLQTYIADSIKIYRRYNLHSNKYENTNYLASNILSEISKDSIFFSVRISKQIIRNNRTKIVNEDIKKIGIPKEQLLGVVVGPSKKQTIGVMIGYGILAVIITTISIIFG